MDSAVGELVLEVQSGLWAGQKLSLAGQEDHSDRKEELWELVTKPLCVVPKMSLLFPGRGFQLTNISFPGPSRSFLPPNGTLLLSHIAPALQSELGPCQTELRGYQREVL